MIFLVQSIHSVSYTHLDVYKRQRHTYASRCVEQGVDIKSLSEMLGHADVRTTLQVYVHSSLEHKMRVVQSICFLSLAPAADFAPSTFPSHGPETALRQRVFPNLSQIV